MILAVLFRFLPTARNRRFKEVENQIHNLLHKIIKKRKKDIDVGESPKADLLGLLMDSNAKEIQQGVGSKANGNFGMSLDEVIDECKLFYLAGQETTSTLLVWTLLMLSKHRDWQVRAREEVIQTFGSSVPDFEGLSHLKTVSSLQFIHENN